MVQKIKYQNLMQAFYIVIILNWLYLMDCPYANYWIVEAEYFRKANILIERSFFFCIEYV
jgi:hypothetical protein